MARFLLPLLALATTACTIDYGFQADWGHRLRALDCSVEDNARADEEARPIAECSASSYQVSAIWETVELYDASFDPNGLELIDRHWEVLDAPEGSAAKVIFGNDGRVWFTPDMIGTYEIGLGVINEDCIESRGCSITLDVVPDEDLWIEMYWEHANDDMDLHLTTGGAPYESMDDCYYANCIRWIDELENGEEVYETALDWGVLGNKLDDPALDLDDIPGRGPENINIVEPENAIYTVAVHDFPSTIFLGRNKVTVRVFLRGELVYNETKKIWGEGSYTEFVRIDYGSGQVTPL